MHPPFEYVNEIKLYNRSLTYISNSIRKNKQNVSLGVFFFVFLFYYFLFYGVEDNSSWPQLRFHNSTKSFSKSYNRELAELGLYGRVHFVNLSKPLPPVTFVSAISEDYAGEGRSLVVRFAKDDPKRKLFIYDIGLSKATRKWFDNACNVIVKDIDLQYFRVSLNAYQWKPLVIAKALKEVPIVIWMDSSTVWAPNLTIVDFIAKVGITDKDKGPHVYLLDSMNYSTFAVTAKGMYEYLSPLGDVYQKQYGSKIQLYIRTRATYELVLKWYVLCALESNCIAPRSYKYFNWDCNFSVTNVTHTEAGCHRHEQSAINIILSPYSKSFLGNWTKLYVWTEPGIEASELDLLSYC